MTKKEILKIYAKFRVPKHVIAHMQKVAYMCEFLASKMIKKGFKIDIKILKNAALLHDVLRMVDFKTIDPDNKLWQNLWKKYHKIGHEKAMARLMRQKGEPKIAKLIARHGFFSIWKLKTWEEKILYYADKRVDHDKIVSLKKRFAEGRKRNLTPKDDLKFVIKTEKEVRKLEKEITKIC